MTRRERPPVAAPARVPAFSREPAAPPPAVGRVVLAHVFRISFRTTLIWTVAYALLVAVTATAYQQTYPDAAHRRRFAAAIGANSGFEALLGVARRLDTTGGFLAWRTGVLAAVGLGIWMLLGTSRLLRGEEESGRWDLLLAGAITARRATASTLAATALSIFVVWLGLVLALVPISGTADLGVLDIVGYATGLAGVAACFSTGTAVVAQMVPTRRAVAACSGCLLGLAYLLRLLADGNSRLGVLRTATPLGWIENLHAFSGTQPMWLIPLFATAVVQGTGAVLLSGSRDVGGAILPERSAGPSSSRLLGRPAVDVLRLTRTSTIGWLLGSAIGSFAVGSLAPGAARTIRESGLSSRLPGLSRIGIGSVAGYLGLTLVVGMALVLSLQAAGQVAAMREEEASGRLDLLLAAPITRQRWLIARSAAGLGALVLSGVTVGVGAWLGQLTQHGDLTLGRLLSAALALTPPALAYLGVGVALFAVAPRWATAATYGLVALAFFLQVVGVFLRVPDQVLALSPFSHLALAPAESVDRMASVATTLVGLGGLAVGSVAFRRRDLRGA